MNRINKKKLIVFVLILVISVSLIGFITGCGNKSADSTDETNSSADSSAANEGDSPAETGTESVYYAADYLPGNTYGGYEFRIVVPEKNQFDLTLAANVNEETGDIINDAIYKRKKHAQSRQSFSESQRCGACP